MKEMFQIWGVAAKMTRARATYTGHQSPCYCLGPCGRWVSCDPGGGRRGPGPLWAGCLVCVQSGWRVTPTPRKLRER